MQHIALIGTNTVRGSQGIYTVDIAEDGSMRVLATAAAHNAGYLCLHPNRKTLYATREDMVFQGNASGGLGAYRINEDGRLDFINETSVAGQLPCFCCTDKAGRQVFVSSYLNGCVSIHPIREDGGVEPTRHIIQHDRKFDIFPSAHCVAATPDDRYLCFVDVTVHRLVFYSLDDGQFRPVFTHQFPGPYTYRPRQVVFSTHSCYVLTENGHGLYAFRYNPDDPQRLLEERQFFDLTPPEYTSKTTGACVKLSPDGRMLACSVRRINQLNTFRVDADGTLSNMRYIPVSGQCPRDFNFSPDGRYILVALQNSDALALYEVDYSDGSLALRSTLDGVPCGTCVQFLK